MQANRGRRQTGTAMVEAALVIGIFMMLVIGIMELSIYYYFGWIKAAFFETWSPNPAAVDAARPARALPSAFGSAVLVTLALATVLLGLYQEPLSRWLAS